MYLGEEASSLISFLEWLALSLEALRCFLFRLFPYSLAGCFCSFVLFMKKYEYVCMYIHTRAHILHWGLHDEYYIGFEITHKIKFA